MAAQPSGASATPPSFLIIGILAEGGHYSLIKVIDENVEQDQTQHQPLRNTSSRKSPDGLCAANHHPLSASE